MLDVSRIEKIVYGFNFLLYVAMIDTKTYVYAKEMKYGFDGWTLLQTVITLFITR